MVTYIEDAESLRPKIEIATGKMNEAVLSNQRPKFADRRVRTADKASNFADRRARIADKASNTADRRPKFADKASNIADRRARIASPVQIKNNKKDYKQSSIQIFHKSILIQRNKS